MSIRVKPPADVVVSAPLVHGLLAEQHRDLADLPIVKVAEGWDNTLFRLGDELAVRLPRRAAAATLIEHEQQWLPELATRLPLATPVPIRTGVPSGLFPWSWSVVRWLPGSRALDEPVSDSVETAALLERFFRALHQPAPIDAPRNPWRGVPLDARTAALHEHLRNIEALVDRDVVLAVWERARSAPPWPGPALWLHGDLHPGNLLVSAGRLCGVIDFGDVTSGDPATDLSVLWMLPPSIRREFTTWNGDDPGALRTRARGWALALGAAYLAHSRGDDAMAALAHRTIDAALTDE
jgi:aminoglycoside phosphotransferase (APT) family kinase protein